MTIEDVYRGAERMINELIREEIMAQGHNNTGNMAESLTAEYVTQAKADLMEGFAVYYTQFVNDGFPARSASFSQAPFLIEYFESKGYPIYSTGGGLTAVQLAFMTINKWMKEGMPTPASNRFSKVTRRKRMIENAFDNGQQKLDEYMINGLDFVVEERFQKEKSETI